MTDERIVKYLKQNLCTERNDVIGLEEMNTKRLVYLLTKNFNRQVLRKIQRAGFSFRSIKKCEQGYKVMCHFTNDLTEYGVRIEMGAYNIQEFEVMPKEEDTQDNEED